VFLSAVYETEWKPLSIRNPAVFSVKSCYARLSAPRGTAFFYASLLAGGALDEFSVGLWATQMVSASMLSGLSTGMRRWEFSRSYRWSFFV
jgi:hypothetical protein